MLLNGRLRVGRHNEPTIAGSDNFDLPHQSNVKRTVGSIGVNAEIVVAFV